MKYNKSNIMKRAWEMFNNNTHKTFAECLRHAWKEAKSCTVTAHTRYAIAPWMLTKKNAEITSAHLSFFDTFGKDDIIRETEKAYYVRLDMKTSYGTESNYSRNVWLPKSACESYTVYC